MAFASPKSSKTEEKSSSSSMFRNPFAKRIPAEASSNADLENVVAKLRQAGNSLTVDDLATADDGVQATSMAISCRICSRVFASGALLQHHVQTSPLHQAAVEDMIRNDLASATGEDQVPVTSERDSPPQVAPVAHVNLSAIENRDVRLASSNQNNSHTPSKPKSAKSPTRTPVRTPAKSPKAQTSPTKSSRGREVVYTPGRPAWNKSVHLDTTPTGVRSPSPVERTALSSHLSPVHGVNASPKRHSCSVCSMMARDDDGEITYHEALSLPELMEKDLCKRLELENKKLRKELVKMKKALRDEHRKRTEQEAGAQRYSQMVKYNFVKKSMHQWKATELSRTFRAWSESSSDFRRQRRIMKKALFRLNHRIIAQAFNGWTQALAAKRRLQYIAKKTLGRMTHRLTAMTFEAWFCSVIENRSHRAKSHKIVTRMLNRVLAGSFDAWLHFATDARTKRAQITRAASHWLKRGLSVPFRAWERFMQDQRNHKLILERSVGKMTRRQSSSAFQSWVEYKQSADKLKADLAKVGKRWKLMTEKKGLVMSMSGWQTFVSQTKYNRFVMKKIGARMTKRTEFTVYSTWVSAVDEAKEKRNNVRRGLAFWTKRSIAVPFRTWSTAVNDAKEQRVRLTQVAGRWANRRASNAFSSWLAYANGEREHREHLEYIGTKVVKRLLNGLLHRTFGGWQQGHEEKKEQQIKIKKSLARMTNGLQYRCFASMNQFRNEQKRCRALAGKIVARIAKRLEWSCFNAFVQCVDLAKRNKAIMMKIGARWSSRTLARTFDSWYECIADKRIRASKLNKVVQRWTNQTISRSFAGWASYLSKRNHLRRVSRKVVSKWTNGLVSRTFLSWKSCLDEQTKLKQLMGLKKLEDTEFQLAQQMYAQNELKNVNQRLREELAQMKRRIHQFESESKSLKQQLQIRDHRDYSVANHNLHSKIGSLREQIHEEDLQIRNLSSNMEKLTKLRSNEASLTRKALESIELQISSIQSPNAPPGRDHRILRTPNSALKSLEAVDLDIRGVEKSPDMQKVFSR